MTITKKKRNSFELKLIKKFIATWLNVPASESNSQNLREENNLSFLQLTLVEEFHPNISIKLVINLFWNKWITSLHIISHFAFLNSAIILSNKILLQYSPSPSHVVYTCSIHPKKRWLFNEVNEINFSLLSFTTRNYC